jgi:hypothetical protein
VKERAASQVSFDEQADRSLEHGQCPRSVAPFCHGGGGVGGWLRVRSEKT